MSLLTVVVACHPRPDSLTLGIARHLAAVAGESGEARVHDLYADDFDPRLTATESEHVRDGESGPASDTLTARYRGDLAEAHVLVAVHPNWWGKPPAMMSGWLDRVLAPGVAYKLTGGSSGTPEPRLDLAALVVTLGDTPPDRERAEFGDPLDATWRRCVLPYVGAQRMSRHHLSPVNAMTDDDRFAAIVRCEGALRQLLASA